MKKHASLNWSSLFSITTTAICLSLPVGLMAGDVPVPAGSPSAPATSVATIAPALPYGATEVVKMYQGGIGKEVLVNYIETSSLPFHLNADGIIYLQHLGLPQEVTSAMLRRDGELQKMAATYQQPPAAPAPAALPAPAVQAAPPVPVPSTPPPVAPYAVAPDVSAPVAYPDYSVYPYPYYGYPVIVGGGWGWGHGYGWGGRGYWHGGHR